MQVAVEPKSTQDFPSIVEGLTRLSKFDPLVKAFMGAAEEHIGSAGESQLEICLKDLKREYMRGSGLTVAKPVVSYCESIAIKTGGMTEDGSRVYSKMVVANLPNKHHPHMWAEPMFDELCQAVN